MIKQRTVAITGANGFVGSYLVDYFASKGWKVRALVRVPSSLTAKSKLITFWSYDLTQPIDPQVLSGVDVVIHTAYLKHTSSNSPTKKLNMVAAKNLLAMSRQQGVSKSIFFSSMSAGPQALSIYGQQKFAIEKLFNTSSDAVVRPGLIIGNGGLAKTMADFARTKHLIPLIGGGRQPLQVVGVFDIAEALNTIIERNLTGTYTIAQPFVYSYKDFYRHLRRYLATFVLLVPIPTYVLGFIIKFILILRLPLNVTTDNLLGLKQLKSYDTTADMQKLGVVPRQLEEILQKSGLIKN